MTDALYLLDGHAQIYRAYYAPFRELSSPSGEPTRATYVFFSMLFNIVRQRRPTYFAMVIDAEDASASRREVFEDYKTTREPPPDDLLPQIDRILNTCQISGIPIFAAKGHEADDLMASIVHRLRDHDVHIFLVSRDKDLEQLVSERVSLYDPLKNEVIDPARLEQLKGYPPEKAVEVQSLTGDKVDDIPGIAGVGVKTAAKLIRKYGSADEVIRHADELTPKMSEKVKAFSAQLPVTRRLVTLNKDLDVGFDLEQSRFSGFAVEKLRSIFEDLGFTRLLNQLEQEQSRLEPAPTPPRESDPAPPRRVRSAYELVTTREQLASLVRRLGGETRFACHAWTTAQSPLAGKLVGLSFSWSVGKAAYVPLRGVGSDLLSETEVFKELGPLFESAAIQKCGHDIKSELVVLSERGVQVSGELFDTMIASFLLDPVRRSHSLPWLAREFYDHSTLPLRDLVGSGKDQIPLDQVDVTRVCEYASECADFTLRLSDTLKEKLEGSAAEQLFRETEMPLVCVLAAMERSGVALDCSVLEVMSRELDERTDLLAKQIYALAGAPFNIDSTKQLAAVLFDQLALRVVRKTKTGRSTDMDTLSTLASETEHPLPGLVIEYRELSKLKSTYVDSLPRMINARTGRIHASFNQVGAVTGRLSSNDPNLQNIPIRTELGRKIRRAFVAGGAELVLLTADYSQIELRLLAHYSQDRALLEAFQKDQDIHRFVAAQVYGVDLPSVSSEQRGKAKAVNFGIIYGQTPFGLSRGTGMSVSDARRFIDLYFQRYPGIQRFIDDCIERARDQGYAETILGRHRPIPQLHSQNRQQRALGERLAVNTVLQGSAADLIKRAMVDIHKRLVHQHHGTRMLIQVHDELVFEVPRPMLEEEARQIRAQMCKALPLGVPLRVDVCWGSNWLDGKPISA